jgi:hypothetical protein
LYSWICRNFWPFRTARAQPDEVVVGLQPKPNIAVTITGAYHGVEKCPCDSIDVDTWVGGVLRGGAQMFLTTMSDRTRKNKGRGEDDDIRK